MDGKKISFGFAKISKKAPLAAGPASNVSLNSKDNSVQMIDCLEGQTIKIIGQTEELPTVLVIPLREQDKTTVPDRLAKLIGIRQEKQLRTQTVQSQPNSVSYHNSEVNGETTENPVQVKTEPPEEDVTQPVAPVMEETLEQRAAREILENLHESNVKKEEQSNFVVPLLPEELPLDGARESTMDDYESVPIDKFGLAMLRGMGWKDDPNKDSKAERTDTNPTPRPKGLGLGADKGLKAKAANSVLIPPAEGEVLVMKRGAQVKVLAGKHKDAYGIDDAPENIILLDWQVSCYGSPVLDLVYFIFCCTDEEFRRLHYVEMLDIYHNSLSALLKLLGHDPQQVFPRSALDLQLQQFGRFGLMLAVLLVPLQCTASEDLPDLDDTAETFRDTQTFDAAVFTKNANQIAFRKRMSGVIRDTIRYGYM